MPRRRSAAAAAAAALAAALVLLAATCVAAAVDAGGGGAALAAARTCGWEGEFFPGVPARVPYEGPDSTNPMAFKYYNADEVVAGRPMKEWLKFSLAFWHTMRGDGSDPFGSPTKAWPWEDAGLAPVPLAKRRLSAFFELVSKLGVQYWAFHDRDIAPELPTLAATNAALDEVAAYAARLQDAAGARVLWGTAQLFKHPRYAHGAATAPNATVFAYAAAQVKKAMEVTHALGGRGYVFWGGREGYNTLLNTDMRLELDNLARFMRLAADYKRKLGFTGPLLLEPKPQEPTKHQYDWDAAAAAAFLLRHGLQGEFALNIECNHATLAGHSCAHELTWASAHGLLGALDANTGDPQTGWDTDQFLTDPREATELMAIVLAQGGLPVGINFDAKLRRESTAVDDLAIAHIGGMDALARGLRNAARMADEGVLARMRAARYASWRDTELGRSIVGGTATLEGLAAAAEAGEDPAAAGLPSAQAELYEMWFARYVR